MLPVPVVRHYICSLSDESALTVSLGYGDEGHEGCEGTSEDEVGQWTLERIPACDDSEPCQPQVGHSHMKARPQQSRTYRHVHRQQASRASMRSSVSLLPRMFSERRGSMLEAVEARASAHQQALLAVFGTPVSSPSDGEAENSTPSPRRMALADRVTKAITELPQILPPSIGDSGIAQGLQRQRIWLMQRLENSFSRPREDKSFSGGSFSQRFSSSFKSRRQAGRPGESSREQASSFPSAIYYDRNAPPIGESPVSVPDAGVTRGAGSTSSILRAAGMIPVPSPPPEREHQVSEARDEHRKTQRILRTAGLNVSQDEPLGSESSCPAANLARARASKMAQAGLALPQGHPPKPGVSLSRGVNVQFTEQKTAQDKLQKAAMVADKKRRLWGKQPSLPSLAVHNPPGAGAGANSSIPVELVREGTADHDQDFAVRERTTDHDQDFAI